MIKIIFFGSGEFAKIILQNLTAKKDLVKIIAVITKPDKPAQRWLTDKSTPAKIEAQKNNLKILEPLHLKEEFINEIKKYRIDLIIIADYGKIIPQKVLDIAKFGAFNVHPSLLPLYRGPSPIESAILNGDKETGLTIMVVDKEMDHGPIIYREKIDIEKKDNLISLRQKLADLGGKLIIKAVKDLSLGDLKTKEQNHSAATYCLINKKENGKIEWQKSAQELENQVKAFIEWPTSYCFWTNEKNKISRLKILKAEAVADNNIKKTAGEILIKEKKLLAACGKDYLFLESVKPESKKEMSGYEFILGHQKLKRYE